MDSFSMPSTAAFTELCTLWIFWRSCGDEVPQPSQTPQQEQYILRTWF